MIRRLAFFRNKKGNIVDVMVAVLVLLVLGLISMCLSWVLHELQPEMDETITDNRSNEVMNDFVDRTPASFDNTWIVLFVLFWIGAVVLAYFVDSHPIFFGFILIILVIILVVGGYMSNIYSEFSADMGEGAYFPATTYVMEHLLQFILGIAASVILAMFAKFQSS